MLSPEEQQIEIYLLKANLDEIKNEIVTQKDIILSVDAENELQNKETKNALCESHSLNTEMERLKLDNVRLSAKRIQLTRQCDEVQTRLQRARENRLQLVLLLKEEEAAIEAEVRNYEDKLQQIADRFRQTRAFANEDAINNEIEKMKVIISELDAEMIRCQRQVNELQTELDSVVPSVPEDILDIIGKQQLDEKMKALISEIETLTSKRNHLLHYRTNTAQFLAQGFPV